MTDGMPLTLGLMIYSVPNLVGLFASFQCVATATLYTRVEMIYEYYCLITFTV